MDAKSPLRGSLLRANLQLDLSCAWRLTKAMVTMDFRKRQTIAASPAEPGDLPHGLARGLDGLSPVPTSSCQRSRQLAIAVSAIFSSCAQTRYLSEIKSERTDGVIRLESVSEECTQLPEQTVVSVHPCSGKGVFSRRCIILNRAGDPRLCRGGSNSLTFPEVHRDHRFCEPRSTRKVKSRWTSLKV